MYGRSLVTASNTSATAQMRPHSGMSLPARPAGIARAVPTLVMMQRDHPAACRICDEELSRIRLPIAECCRITVHSCGIERCRLPQNRFGHGDLAHIVHAARVEDQLDLGRAAI